MAGDSFDIKAYPDASFVWPVRRTALPFGWGASDPLDIAKFPWL